MNVNRTLSHAEVQHELLNLLIELDALFEKEGLRYSLCGGTLLGAIRHKGFIPWDDDIDIAMPRPDFERFLVLSANGALSSERSVETIPTNGGPVLLAKYVNQTLAVKERYISNISHLWIDVLPVDGLPSDDREVVRIYKRAGILRRLIRFCRANENDGKSIFTKVAHKIGSPAARMLGIEQIVSKKVDSLSRKYDFGSTGYAGIITWGLYGPGERFSDTAFDSRIKVDFEGRKFSAISCFDSYLSGIYGNYMQLPPENKRETHEATVWRIS